MLCRAHQRQLSYQPKQEKEFTQNLERIPDDLVDWDANDPAPSSEDPLVEVKPPRMRSFWPSRNQALKATTTHRIIGSAQ